MFSISLGGLLSEAMPDQHWWVRYRTKSAYIATFTWLAMACLVVHAYRLVHKFSLINQGSIDFFLMKVYPSGLPGVC